MFQVAVLISGKGSTLEAILKDQKRDSLYEVSLVLADRPCEGLRYAEMEGIRTKILPRIRIYPEGFSKRFAPSIWWSWQDFCPFLKDRF